MNLSAKDYNRLYRLQDKFLSWWVGLKFPFYLTGGTSLGRFYLNHRFSEDLDFFVNNDKEYLNYVDELKNKITDHFTVDQKQLLFAGDFTRFFIEEKGIYLKIELVNEIGNYIGEPAIYKYGKIDTPVNILANKLTAIVGRDEPKDIFDIIHIALNYSFNWPDIFYYAKQKAIINELDIVQRLVSFPVEWLENVNWLITPLDSDETLDLLKHVADDFLLGLQNSLGKEKIPIELAKPMTL